MTHTHQHPQLRIFSKKEKAKILKKLKEQFGITKLPGIIIQRGAERIFLYQGDLTEKQIQELEKTLPIERAGIYFGKEQDNKIRLSIDAIHLLKNQITKNIFKLNDKQANKWMHGNELEIKTPKKQHGFKIIKYKDDFLGTGKASAEKISNFVPKQRRLKEKGN